MSTAFIVDAVRTARAKKSGKFSNVHPVDLLTYPLNALIQRNNLNPENIDDVLVGCVTQTSEQGWCVGRAAVLAAGWPNSVPATTINRLCGSGQQACNFAAAGLISNAYQLTIGAGLEHMTRVPMFSDSGGETSPKLNAFHPDLIPQGLSAELICETYKLSRSTVDEYAYNSQIKAAAAQTAGFFKKSIIPVPYLDENKQQIYMEQDDTVRASTTIEGLTKLKPVFKENGVITAGNASAIVDGAAAVLLANESSLTKYNLKPRARVVATLAIGSEPKIMLTGPIEVSKQILKIAGLQKEAIDIWEINEAFAPVPIITMQALDIDPAIVNVNGGGISLGHPLGATGAMLIGTALDELERRQGRYALVTMCIGLGMGIATIIERV